jgi:transposase
MLLRALGVERAVVKGIAWETDAWTVPEEPQLVVWLQPVRSERRYCPHCGRRGRRYDAGHGERRWRAPDFGLVRVHLVAPAPRVRCPEHGVVVARVPWARHRSGFTRAFEDTVAWLVTRTDKSTLATLLRVAWRTVGAILERVVAEMRARIDPLDKLERIGIDEVSYRKGHRYLTVVVDHASGNLVWAHPKADAATLQRFFDQLGPKRCARLYLVSADAAAWIRQAVRSRCPQATLCIDPFHVVQWATAALDQIRRALWNQLRQSGQPDLASSLKHARWALYKNPENLTTHQQRTLAAIQRANQPLYRAYLLKEQLREVVRRGGRAGKRLLDRWLAWASRSKLAPFVMVARTIRAHRAGIDAALDHGLSNARTEANNNQLRLLTRLAYGFHSPAPLIALAMLKLGGLCPSLPGRI